MINEFKEFSNFTEIEVRNLLNENVEKIQSFINSYKNEIKQIKEYKYINFFDDGIGFCLVNDIIESIYLYNKNIMKFNK